MANILVLLLLVFFIFAVVGIQLFGRTRYGANTNEQVNFGDFPTAMLVLFRVAVSVAPQAQGPHEGTWNSGSRTDRSLPFSLRFTHVTSGLVKKD